MGPLSTSTAVSPPSLPTVLVAAATLIFLFLRHAGKFLRALHALVTASLYLEIFP